MDRASIAAEVLTRAAWPGPGEATLIRALIRYGQIIAAPAGRRAHGEGDPDTGVLVVLAGTAELLCQAPGGREILISRLGPGDAIGQTVRLGGGPRLVTVVCREDCLLLKLSDRALDRVAGDAPGVWQAVGALLYRQLAGLLQQLAETTGLPPAARLAARLALLTGPSGGGRGEPAMVRLGQHDLAEMTGLSRKTVNGHLARFEAAGLVRRAYGAVAVIDPAGLRRLSEAGA